MLSLLLVAHLAAAAPPAKSRAPVGLSAYGGLAPGFPRAGLLAALAEFDQPFVSLLADFGRLYAADNLTMFVGEFDAARARPVNPRHAAALAGFAADFCETAGATGSTATLQLFVLNGPGQRGARSRGRRRHSHAAPHLSVVILTITYIAWGV